MLLVALLLMGLAPLSAAELSKPNIIFVLYDDLGYGEPPSYNPKSALRTPILDKLATQGMRFTDAHTAAAVCTPTRYGLLTGRYPSRIGQFGVLTTFSKPIIPPGRPTVASLLKSQGYTTACIGKWHLGMDWVAGKPGSEKEVPIGAKMTGGPNALGFDYFYGFTHARNIGTIIEQDQVVAHVAPVANQPLMAKKVVEWLDQRKASEPFFLYFPVGIPHEPIVPSDEFIGKSGAQDLVKKDPSMATGFSRATPSSAGLLKRWSGITSRRTPSSLSPVITGPNIDPMSLYVNPSAVSMKVAIGFRSSCAGRAR